VTESAHFQVDLRPLVDLLGRHLYSSPRVFLRELLQNAVDAITERRRHEQDAPARIEIVSDRGVFTIRDTGVGLTRDQVADLLATIGRSSKRDAIGFARDDFLGQFGIGLLSAFMVADEVRFLTWPGYGEATLWVGRADGTYTITSA
jgi:molecular chaperone HtpG